MKLCSTLLLALLQLNTLLVSQLSSADDVPTRVQVPELSSDESLVNTINTKTLGDTPKPDLNSTLRIVTKRQNREPKAVFAHFMVGNVKTWDVARWRTDIQKAQEAHIDGFALNIAHEEEGNENSLNNAFDAADSVGFKLIFSFDYPGGKTKWPAATVIDYLIRWGTNRGSTYYKKIQIKSSANAFFIPDWSSRGARGAMQQANGVADGLFSWASWPWGNRDMDTYVDASYAEYLGGKEYMMPVSPWFYTNMPGYNKNWLWRGDDLWHDRWDQVITVDPQFVQIISWNDYGESHYIGPLTSDGYKAFDREFGNAPFNYVLDMPHDGWRALLPYSIDLYKNGIATITEEIVVTWYRPTLALACGSGGTTGNTATQLQIEFDPNLVALDKIFFSALLTADATVSVTIGGVALGGTWENRPPGNVGIFHGSVLIGGRSGAVTVEVRRAGVVIGAIAGKPISNTCPNAVMNWNAYVGGPTRRASAAKQPVPLSSQACIAGTGPGNFAAICAYVCKYGYCPISACQCTAREIPITKPTPSYKVGYPGPGMTASFEGLCNFACNLDFPCTGVCGTVKLPMVIPTVSPFLPPACIKGTGAGQLAGLCDYSCNFGFCPIGSCKCTQEGALNQPPAQLPDIGGILKDGTPDSGLCDFTCSRDYCPDICVKTSKSQTGPVCTAGTGLGPYADLCKYTCSRGYCPKNVCSCTTKGPAIRLLVTSTSGCTTTGVDNSFAGLCRFSCAQGYCPTQYCTSVSSSTQCSITTTAESREDRLARLNRTYKGIYWEDAMPDGGVGDCTIEQLNILEEATRVGLDMVSHTDNEDGGPEMHDTAFHQFFVVDNYVQFRWELNYPARYRALTNNMEQVWRFPLQGPKNGRTTQPGRITYQCKEVENMERCSKDGVPTRVGAYTAQGPSGPSQKGTTISFCPLFFQQRFINSVMSEPDKRPYNLGDVGMRSYELLLIHEWMHCDRMGMNEHIIDIDAYDPTKAVYGASRCHNFAHKYMEDPQEFPNPDTVINADNYAWTYTYRAFAERWGWPADFGIASSIPSDVQAFTAGNTELAGSFKPKNPPPNCITANGKTTCSYMGTSYQDWLLDEGYACDCDGNGCSETSPACCASGTCPVCNCGENGCGESPTCCGSGTCQWATVGNRNMRVGRVGDNSTLIGTAIRNGTSFNGTAVR